MSKITLEPNSSGAGTFSIVSPDSNTNRTLNLPDEAGTILSDASTIDSNNLQSDVYKQDNILGTVSESGGVPTGAIIERGSNSNGEFVKYADGTIICMRVVSVDFNNSGFVNFSYPASIVSEMGGSFAGGARSFRGGDEAERFAVSTLRLRGAWNFRVNRTYDDNQPVRLFAIGRWF